MEGMSNSKQWTVRVFVSPPTVPGQPVPKAIEVVDKSFRIPSTVRLDKLKREARKRIDAAGYTVRSVSVAAPIERREVLVYLEERAKP
jgi:hypothetical protein